MFRGEAGLAVEDAFVGILTRMEDGDFTVVTKGSKRCARPKKGVKFLTLSPSECAFVVCNLSEIVCMMAGNGPSYSPSSSAALDADSFEAGDVLKGVIPATPPSKCVIATIDEA